MSESLQFQPRRIVVNGHEALIEFDPTTDLYCGRFVGISGSAPFYARKEKMIRTNATRSLAACLKKRQSCNVAP